MAGAATESSAGAPTDGGSTDEPSTTGGTSADVVAKGGQEPSPGGAAPEAGSTMGGKPSSAGSDGGLAGSSTVAGMGGAVAGTAGGTSGPKCPADFYCHELGPDAFAKCVIEPTDPDPNFPGCEISRGTCFYPKDAPAACITDDCWSTKRACD